MDTFTPTTQTELARFITENAAGRKQILSPVGGRTALHAGSPGKPADVMVDLTALDRVIDYPARDMTVTVEAFHGCKVNVEVLDRKRDTDHYSRRILLRRSSDNQVVQFGIVRLDMRAIPKPAMDAILSEQIPLGQTLIDNGVLRRVELCHLWKIELGADLAKLFSAPPGEIVYGRTAMIHVDEQPAIELLEIVTNR